MEEACKAISIHALREEGDGYEGAADASSWISIHALREEGDLMLETPSFMMPNFYPRPPRGGRPMVSSIV